VGTTADDYISAASRFPENDPHKARRDALVAEHEHDLTRGVSGFGRFERGAARRSLFYGRLIVIYPEHPISNFMGKQRLVRELPQNGYAPKLSVALNWQRWCHRQAR
jgi:hypothetical protein